MSRCSSSIVAALLLAAAECSAQFSVSTWAKLTNEYRLSGAEWETIETEAYSSAYERVQFFEIAKGVGYTFPDEPSFWRSGRANLVSDKEALYQIDYFGAEDGGWVGDNVVSSSTNIFSYRDFFNKEPSDTTRVGETNVYHVLGLPFNYLSYTPWRMLSGRGIFTNDVTVGAPHGYSYGTNAFTTTHFPGSRTNWYTTDYGWNNYTGIVHRMSLYGGEAGSMTRTSYNVSAVSPVSYDAAYAIAITSTVRTSVNSHVSSMLVGTRFSPAGTQYLAEVSWGWTFYSNRPRTSIGYTNPYVFNLYGYSFSRKYDHRVAGLTNISKANYWGVQNVVTDRYVRFYTNTMLNGTAQVVRSTAIGTSTIPGKPSVYTNLINGYTYTEGVAVTDGDPGDAFTDPMWVYDLRVSGGFSYY